MSVQPTLLVGVGGTGCDIASRVYAMAHANNVLGTNRIAILGFDTDENDIQNRRKEMPTRQLIRTSTAATVFQLLYKNRPQLQDWFAIEDDLTTEIRQMNLTDGAGQVRMLSRLAFQSALQDPTISADMENALHGLGMHDNQNKIDATVNVFLVGSLAGGTGSGMFLQTTLVLAQKLREKGFTPQMRGLFLLPDIFIKAARMPVDQHHNVLANSYAALRELNAIQLKTANRNPLPLLFDYLPGHGLQPDGLPFTSLVLLDYENTKGGNMGLNFEAYKQMASRAAYTLLFTPIGGRADSVTVNDIRSRMAAAAQDTLNCYASIGVGSVEYPYEKMLDYLALQLGLKLLEGDWLRLDQLFSQELAAYQQRLNNGETGLKPPQRGESYIRNLQLLAKERVPLFRQIHDKVERPEPATAAGPLETSPPQYIRYLDDLESQITERFWSSQEILKDLRSQQSLNYEALNERDSLMTDVSGFERQRLVYRSAVRDALDEVPLSLFLSVVRGGDTRGPNEWDGYHLQSFIIKNSPHLVQVRYFLYQVLAELQKRVAALEDEKKREALKMQDETKLFDNPKTEDYTENALERAGQVMESSWPAWMDREFKQFVGDYRKYFNDYVQTLKKYAEHNARRRVYEKLELYLRNFLSLLEQFFNSLSDLRIDLKGEVSQAENEHQPGTGIVDGTLYVYASRNAKQELWEEICRNLAGASGDDKSNATLTEALYQRYQEESQKDRWNRLPPFSGKALFREAMIEVFCRKLLIDQHQDKYRFNVIKAISRDAEMAGESRNKRLIDIIDLVFSQSEPYLSFNTMHPNGEGQTILFWAVSPTVEKAVGNENKLFETLFKRHAGEQPLVEEEFPNHILLCLNTRVNLMLDQLRKLHPGDPTEKNVAAPQQGSYDQAYREMLQRILEDKRKHTNKAARDFTPHLDREWHKPGVLPEIVPGFDDVHQIRWQQAFVLGVALDLLRQEVRYGEPVTVLYDRERQGTPEGEQIVQQGHDDLALLELLRTRPDWIEAIHGWADKVEAGRLDAQGQTATEPEQTVLYQGLRSAEVLARILRLSTNRSPAAQADEKTSRAMETLFRKLHAFVTATRTELAPPEQFALIAGELQAQINDALPLLQQPPTALRPETLQMVQNLAEGTRNKLLLEWKG